MDEATAQDASADVRKPTRAAEETPGRPEIFLILVIGTAFYGTLGLLVRSAQVRGQPSWADVQFAVFAVGPSYNSGWRLHVELPRCRGSHAGQSVDLEIDEWTGHVGQVFNLSLPTSGQVENLSYAEPRHETHPLRPAAQLATAAAGHLVAV